jgi:hypothetical protein
MSLEEQRSFGGNLVKTYQCHETLLDAMKSQLEANKKLVNEIIAKAEAFDKEYKPVTKKTKP